MDSENPQNPKNVSGLISFVRLHRLLLLGVSFIVLAMIASIALNARRPSINILNSAQLAASPPLPVAPSEAEYLWYEAENMRGISETPRHEPVLNPSYLDLPASKAPGWAISGPGVSAEWSQGGESEWNSVAAAADETHGTVWQDCEVPRAGNYRIWVRYADWANKSENFAVQVAQGVRPAARHEFGTKDVIDPHDETSMYWGWSFAWDSFDASLTKGPARISIEISRAAQARRQVDCVLLTNDLSFVPAGRSKPEFAATRYLSQYAASRPNLMPLIEDVNHDLPSNWSRPALASRDFVMPWNIAKDSWQLYQKPPAERPLFPFNAEPADEFVKTYSGKRDVPIFNSELIVPVIYLNDLPELLKEGSGFRRYLSDTHTPFAILINYGNANFTSDADAQTAWNLLNGELRNQFLGWISGESIGFVWDQAPRYLTISPDMTRGQLLDAHKNFYSDALARKWSATFKTQTGPMWDKMIPAMSTSSTSFMHALGEWGVRLFGIETAAAQPMTAMRLAFDRGAARQYRGDFLYYHAPNFGDTATTFTRQQNFAGPDNFFHSRYGATMGPSLSWYRKSYYLYYMSGASAIYLEQGFDQFFKPGPGEHPFQLNPLGRITDEFIRFADKHPNRGVPYTPIAFLLDQAHGWDMTDYPHWPFEVSQINRSDRSLRELFGAAYYPGLVREGEPASGERQAFIPAIFGNIFDVVVTSETRKEAIDSYQAVVAGGQINWSSEWIKKLQDYVRGGGVIILNSTQIKNLPEDLVGLHLTGKTGESHNANCLSAGEPPQDLHGNIFRFDEVELKGAQTLIATPANQPLVTINKVGRGKVVFIAMADALGEDERMPPFVAHVLAHLAGQATPIKVEGEVEYLVNRNDRGWVVTLFNDNGIYKPQQGLANVDRTAHVTAKLSLRNGAIASASEWISDRSLAVSNNNVSVTIAPGSIAVVELVSKR